MNRILRVATSCVALALLAPTLLAPGARAQPAPHPERLAFVLNSADASISEIDIDSRQEVRRIPVLREPHHMATTPDGRSLVVGDTAGNALFFLDPVTGAMQRRITVSDPYQISYSPDGRWLTVAGLARNQVDIYDAASMTLAHRVPAKAMPSHINYAPDSSTVYVSLQDSGRLMAIETATGRVRWDSKVGSTPAGVLWHEGHVLVANMGTDFVAVVDPADGHVEREIHMAAGPHNLFITPDHKRLYVTCRVSGTIEQLDWNSLDVVRSYRLPGGPDDIVFGPDGSMWATLRWRQHVAVLDLASGRYTTIATGRSPHGIWLNTALPGRRISMLIGRSATPMR
ncbi:PQQ-binding-like beta-propeller repeat protein [Lichenicoccus sp.]|uniref:YVTN family beta-propeller repeat protein n=1 Tax=Lichenicoccus sp. TaxID=2781899 RepID=UPI003D0D1679